MGYRAGLRGVLGLAALCSAILPGIAGAESYVYDGLGRLVLTVSDNGQQTQYSYDAAGNRTQVTTATGSSSAPTASDATATASTSAITVSPSFSGGSLASISQPQYGTASISGSSIIYTPASWHAIGADIFTYTVTNGSGLSTSAVVRVTLQ